MAGSRGGKTTSKDGRDLSLAVEVGRQHPRIDGFMAGSRGGKTTYNNGRAYGWQ